MLKLPNCNNIFMEIYHKITNLEQNCQLYVTAENFSYPKRKIIPVTSFRISN